MSPNLKARLEGAAWTVAAAFLTSFATAIQHDGFQQHDLTIAGAAALATLAAFIRGLYTLPPWDGQDRRSDGQETPKGQP